MADICNTNKKQNSKASHAHVYEPCLLHIDTGNPIRKRIPFVEIAEYCVICNKIGRWNCFLDAAKIEQFTKDNPTAPTFVVKYKDRYVKKF